MPETTAYLLVALLLSFSIVGAFITSVMLRFRSLHKDLELIQQLREE